MKMSGSGANVNAKRNLMSAAYRHNRQGNAYIDETNEIIGDDIYEDEESSDGDMQ